MSLLEQLSDEACWERFYNYKTSLSCPKTFAKELRRFIDARGWEPVCEEILQKTPFPLPSKAVISKQSSQKKRTVYTYPAPENTVLKLLTWLLLRKYDGLFSDNLYSFRPGITAKDAVRRLRRTKDIGRMYSYKADISNYFNSVPVEKLLPMLSEALADDAALLSFLSRLLTEPRVVDGSKGVMKSHSLNGSKDSHSLDGNRDVTESHSLDGNRDVTESHSLDGNRDITESRRIITEQKGIMAGTVFRRHHPLRKDSGREGHLCRGSGAVPRETRAVHEPGQRGLRSTRGRIHLSGI